MHGLTLLFLLFALSTGSKTIWCRLIERAVEMGRRGPPRKGLTTKCCPPGETRRNHHCNHKTRPLSLCFGVQHNPQICMK